MDDTLPPKKTRSSTASHSEQAKQAGQTDEQETRTSRVLRKTVGPYEVEARIGKGGMGKVYRCKDKKLGRQVAVKVLHDKYGQDEHYQARFRREARSLASLSHPSIAQIFSIDTAEDGSLYIVMEFVEGRSVQEILAEDGRIPVEDSIRFVRQMAQGLQAALDGGLIHRDIKPSNLLARPDGTVKIVDFGLSKEVSKDNTLTEEGIVLGTPHYISPEQGRGKPVDHRSDIYALGATFYHMVTGRPPFEGKSQVSIIVAHVQDNPDDPRTLCPDLPESLGDVIGRMMARNVADRYDSYDQLVEDLQLLETGKQPVHTATGTGTGRFSRKSSRGALRWLGFAAGFLALLVLTATTTSYALRRYRTGMVHSIEDRLGSWCLPRPTGGSTLDLDFSAVPADKPQALRDVFILKPSSSDGKPPTLRKDTGKLRLENYREPLAFSYPFSRLDEVQLSFDRPEGRADIAISIVDPLDNRRRSLTLRLSPSRKTSAPLEALRHGDEVLPQSPLPAIPPLNSRDAAYKVFLEMIPSDGSTWLKIKIVELNANEILYSQDCSLPGGDWAGGAVVLRTSFYRRPCSIDFSKMLLSGTLAGSRLEEVPWQD